MIGSRLSEQQCFVTDHQPPTTNHRLMNCERCQLNLEDFLYGELAERLAAEIREHLSGCAACSAERTRLESENALFAEFYEQTAVEPAVESWAAIRARIAAEPIRSVEEEKVVGWRAMFGWLMIPSLARQAAFALAVGGGFSGCDDVVDAPRRWQPVGRSETYSNRDAASQRAGADAIAQKRISPDRIVEAEAANCSSTGSSSSVERRR
jgi:hypothetical protein